MMIDYVLSRVVEGRIHTRGERRGGRGGRGIVGRGVRSCHFGAGYDSQQWTFVGTLGKLFTPIISLCAIA